MEKYQVWPNNFDPDPDDGELVSNVDPFAIYSIEGVKHSSYPSKEEAEAAAKKLNDAESKVLSESEIRDNADRAETFPGSGKLNWSEISLKTLIAWADLYPNPGLDKTINFDVENVKIMFEAWWKRGGK